MAVNHPELYRGAQPRMALATQLMFVVRLVLVLQFLTLIFLVFTALTY